MEHHCHFQSLGLETDPAGQSCHSDQSPGWKDRMSLSCYSCLWGHEYHLGSGHLASRYRSWHRCCRGKALRCRLSHC